MSEVMRHFDGGATRDLADDKLDYAKALCPMVLNTYVHYLGKHRDTPAGKRDWDNWKSGIPKEVYMSSMFRHMMDVWFHVEGTGEYAEENFTDALCAVLFNAQGMLHEVLKDG